MLLLSLFILFDTCVPYWLCPILIVWRAELLRLRQGTTGSILKPHLPSLQASRLPSCIKVCSVELCSREMAPAQPSVPRPSYIHPPPSSFLTSLLLTSFLKKIIIQLITLLTKEVTELLSKQKVKLSNSYFFFKLLQIPPLIAEFSSFSHNLQLTL